MSSTVERIVSALRRRVSYSRFRHVERVVRLGDALATRFDVDRPSVALACWAHDYDRELGAGRLLAYAADWSVGPGTVERISPVLIHGKVTAERMKRQWRLTDQRAIDAVRFHTLGVPGMSPVGLILFVADFCEPGRGHLRDSERKAMLGPGELSEVALRVLEAERARFGRLEEPTFGLYAQLTKGASWPGP